MLVWCFLPVTCLALPANAMSLGVSAGFLRTLLPLGLMWVYRHILLPVPSYSGLPSPPLGAQLPWVGWVGFQIQIRLGQVTLLPRVLEPKCHNDHDICDQVAGCGLVNVVY